MRNPALVDNCQSFQSVDAGHGRIETRTALISIDIDWLQERHDELCPILGDAA